MLSCIPHLNDHDIFLFCLLVCLFKLTIKLCVLGIFHSIFSSALIIIFFENFKFSLKERDFKDTVIEYLLLNTKAVGIFSLFFLVHSKTQLLLLRLHLNE